jgi:hypothetical protein
MALPAWRRILEAFGARSFSRAEADRCVTPQELEKLLDIGMLGQKDEELRVLDPAEWEKFARELGP